MIQQYCKLPLTRKNLLHQSIWMKTGIILLFVFSFKFSEAQISIIQNSNSQTISQLLAGSGVTISNYSVSCHTTGTGTFSNTGSNLGLTSGVVLTTGNINKIPGSANKIASTAQSLSGDTHLSTLTSGTIFDPCRLEFDIVPDGPLLRFNYVFASEEYPEWVCSNFNDVFGFFISGPNPGGGNYTNKNIATIPGTNLPVAINTINAGSPGANAGGGTCIGTNQSLAHSALYKNNLASPVNQYIIYDAQTHVLQANIAVVPCQTYRLKLAIADVADRVYDSGLFLEAHSFASNSISVSGASSLQYGGSSSAYEGCVNGVFTLALSQVQQTDVFVNLAISGTATNGTDYITIPSVVMIPAGQTSIQIPLTPLQDGLIESNENVTLAVLDPCNGIVSSSASITISDNIPATITVADSALCLGQSTQLTAAGGVSYNWTPTTGLSNPNVNNPNATPTTTTTYTANMQFGSCTKIVSQTIYVSNPVVTINTNPTTGTICDGESVILTANSSAGAFPYNYLWSTGSVSSSITIATGGSYNVTSIDSYGCSASATRDFMISNLSISGVVTNVSFFGGNNGLVDITVSGSNTPFTYDWGGGIVSQDRINVTAGTYTVTASNTIGCSVTASYNVTQPASNLTTSATNTSVNCNGGDNGSINLTVNGGVTPYTFVWSNGATTEDLNLLIAGSYSVTVSDFNGSTATRTVTITQPTAIVTATTQTNVNCNGESTGSINLSVSGAIGPYTFAWSNGASTQNITSVNAGTYTVIVSDANGCTTTHSATITQPAPIDITSTSVNPSCNGNNNGSISLTTVGGTSPYTYAWSNSATSEDITNLTVGNYIVTVNDANACSALISSTITEPTALMVSATSTPVSCFGGNNGATNVTTSGGTTGYVFNWSNGVTTEDLNTIVAGSYTLTVTDNNNCTATRNVVITQPNLLSTTISSNNILCNSASTGTVDLMVNGGTIPYNYNWSNAATTEDLSTLSAGGYSVTVTDANNCSATNSTTLTQPSALVVSETHLDVLCNGAATGMIDITATGGTGNLSYNWSNGDNAQDISGVFAGNYTVTVSDANTCSVTQNITIQQPTPFIIGLQYNNVACNGGVDGNINLSISGGTPPYTFDWNNEANTEDLTNIAAGNYFVIINDVNNCVANANTTITQPNILSLTFTQTNLSCFNDNKGSIDINTEGGSFPFSYNWNDGTNTQDRNNLKAGTYDVTVTDANACQEVIQGIVITNPSEITVNLQITDIDCGSTNKGNILTQVIGGAGNYSFNWSNGSTANQITNQPTGSYSLTVADANGCTQSASGFINTLPQLQITSLIDQLVCVQDRGSIDVTVAGGTTPFNFSWNTGSTTEDLNNIQPGNYSLLVTDANGCTISETFNVINTNSFNVNTTGSATITMGETAILNAVTTGSNQTTYNWTPAINHTCPNCQSTTVQPGSTTLYTVIATDTNGCIAQDTVTVKVIADYNIFTPNAFTPNGDGNNDYLQIFGNLAGVKKLDLMIFNRWGEKVYETNDVNFQWDGRFKGDLIESSVLVYVMKIVHLDGYNQKVFKGSITILR